MRVRSWFGDAGAEIDLRRGGAMTITRGKHGTVHARVERVEAPRVFAYRWARGADTPVRDDNSTLVEFTLSPEGGQTRLRVVESGFRALARARRPRWRRRCPSAGRPSSST